MFIFGNPVYIQLAAGRLFFKRRMAANRLCSAKVHDCSIADRFAGGIVQAGKRLLHSQHFLSFCW
jgi:hypothetical protein